MLLNFRIANFRSINEMVELSMIPSDLKNNSNIVTKVNPKATKNREYNALTSAAIYGANASGKSNIIRAFFQFKEFVLKSADKKPNEVIKLYNPFKLNAENLKKPSFFSIDLLIDNILYTYSIEVLNNQIHSENLIYFPKGIRVKVFSRNNNEINKENGYEGIFETIRQRTTENQLFLSKAAAENIEFAKNIFLSISETIVFTTDIFHDGEFNKLATKTLYEDIDVQNYIFPLTKSFTSKIDTQVVDFIQNEGKIKTSHFDNLKNKIEFEFEDESSGTQRVISFMPLVFIALKHGFLIIVDEFERSLHPDIAQYVLSLFNDTEVNKNGAQFVFATHDTTLLSPENKLRRDQINLVEKNKNGETELYSLSDIKGIREGNYEKWYLEGRLGGVPNIARETFRHELIEFINS